MSDEPRVFLSSTDKDLADVKIAVAMYLELIGFQTVHSKQKQFGDVPGFSSYASCLSTLEKCRLVVGIIGKRFSDRKKEGWGYYGSEHTYDTPTQAEIKHAINKNKRLYLYVHQDVVNDYFRWKDGLVVPADFTVKMGYDDFQGTMNFICSLFSPPEHPEIPLDVRTFDNVEHIIVNLRAQLLRDLAGEWESFESGFNDRAAQLALMALLAKTPTDLVKWIEDNLLTEQKERACRSRKEMEKCGLEYQILKEKLEKQAKKSETDLMYLEQARQQYMKACYDDRTNKINILLKIAVPVLFDKDSFEKSINIASFKEALESMLLRFSDGIDSRTLSEGL